MAFYFLTVWPTMTGGEIIKSIAMHSLDISMDWGNTYCSDVTIGSKTVPVYLLERYYRGLHLYDSQAFRTTKYLFSLGIEAVIKEGIFKRQVDVDRVFFCAILGRCEPAFREWVQNWKDVFMQLSTSRFRFKEFIIHQGHINMSKRQYNDMMVEVKNIKCFFRILNMPRAYRLMSIFSNSLHWRYSIIFCSLPKEYPFALKGKADAMLTKDRPKEMTTVPKGIMKAA